MKKIFILFAAVCIFTACKTVEEVKDQTVNCKYTLVGAKTEDFSLSNITTQIAVAIANMSRTKEAKLNRFEGKVYINNSEISDITFGEYIIAPLSTEVAQATLVIPFDKVGKNIAGLVTMNSISIRYKIVGTMYFDTPLGEMPFPVVINQPVQER